MSKDGNDLVESCLECCEMLGHYQNQCHLKLSHANGSLEIFARHILGPLPKASARNQLVIIMTDRYFNLTRAVIVSKTKAWHAALTFVQNWIMHYGIPNFLLTKRTAVRGQLPQRFLQRLSCQRADKNAYHSQLNGQTERYDKTILARLL